MSMFIFDYYCWLEELVLLLLKEAERERERERKKREETDPSALGIVLLIQLHGFDLKPACVCVFVK